MQRELINNACCALSLLKSLFSLRYIKTFAVVNQRK